MDHNKTIEIEGKLLAGNTVLNLIGHIVPLIIGVIVMPFVIKGLGVDRFGVLSLSWVILGYFGIFEFGLGRAATKFISEAFGRNEVNTLPALVWTAVFFQGIFGIISSLVCMILVPFLVEQVLHIPLYLKNEAKNVFFIMAAYLPIGFITGTLRGILSAAQRFKLINTIKIPAASLIYLIPAIALTANLNLPQIVLILVLAQLGAALVHLAFCLKLFPILRNQFRIDRSLIRPLLNYGGWVTVTSVVGPVLTYLDRFLIGSLITVAAVSYYTAPYEVVSRLWILSGSLLMTVFPAFSALWGGQKINELERLFVRSTKYVLLVTSFIVLFLIFFAQEILRIWLGAEFAEKSSLVLQILSLSMLISAVSQVPYTLIQGVGRPDLTAKLHMLEIPLYVVIAWLLIHKIGIEGAAIAWGLRVSLDAFLLFVATGKLGLVRNHSFSDNHFLWSIATLLILVSASLIVIFTELTIITRIVIIIPISLLFGTLAWRNALDNNEKMLLQEMITQAKVYLRIAK
jgi:O-antigen/teichoic acid export membrane protein